MRFDHFGLVAPIYDRVIRSPDLLRLREIAGLELTDRLLDVGGGTGRVSAYLTSWVASVTIVDASHGMLQQATEKGLSTCRGAAERLPFPDGAFDKVVTVDSFHHFANHEIAASELLRVLAPGGRLTIEEPDIRRFIVKLVALGESLALMGSRFRRPDELTRYFQSPETVIDLTATDHTYWLTVDKQRT